ncbi:MAG: hypothetical protein IT173_00230 [Acidobacteria bacterium]|nr:hypothetical protein [Acidobacteriota bacterium]
MTDFSRSQIDRLGERLRHNSITVDDRQLLDDYRRSFSSVYEKVLSVLGTRPAFAPTGRPSKSTISIVDKLARESIRLSQMQDIAGCRVIVGDVYDQDAAVGVISSMFEQVTVIDRRKKPSHGYRAVHIVAKMDGKQIEIQIRTQLQHLWAENVEKFADAFGKEIKYGIGDQEVLKRLSKLSKGISLVETVEAGFAVIEKKKTELPAQYQAMHEDNLRHHAELKEMLRQSLQESIDLLENPS